MESFEIFILLMASAILLVGAAQKMRIPYPIALVLAGAALGFVPGIKGIALDPRTIFVIVLPPILYYGAFWTSFHEFKRNWREIFSLALGLVLLSTLVIGLIFKWLFPDLPWALAFAFGAIVSPPDATVAIALLKYFSISNRLLTVLEGESLINDAAALVFYKLTVTALLMGAFSWTDASLEFIKMGIGGVIIGALAGFSIHMFSIRFLPPVVGVMFSFVVPYITYIVADSLGVSGVLAVVVNGLVLSRIFIKYLPSIRRLLAVTPWDIFIILLNCFVFILIGLELKTIVGSMPRELMVIYIGYSLLMALALIAIRMIWVYATYGIFYFQAKQDKKLEKQCTQIFREGAILGWCGMRGIVSLTAALALPVIGLDDTHLLGRSIVIYLTFVVILINLIIPGLTLPLLLKWLKVHHIHDAHAIASHRQRLLEGAEKEIEAFDELSREERVWLMNYVNARHRLLEISSSVDNPLYRLELARRKILQTQRQILLDMWENKEIDDKLLKTLELELDLEESFSIRAEIK